MDEAGVVGGASHRLRGVVRHGRDQVRRCHMPVSSKSTVLQSDAGLGLGAADSFHPKSFDLRDPWTRGTRSLGATLLAQGNGRHR